MDPSAGGFVSIDALSGNAFDPPSLHKYLYAASDPLGKFDPSGNEYTLSTQAVVTAISSSLTAGLTNAAIDAAIHGLMGKPLTAEEARNAFLLGAVTAPIGGAFANALKPLLKGTVEPLLIAIGSMERVTLIGTRSAWERFLVKVSRIFFNTNVKYPSVGSKPVGRLLQRFIPWIEWNQHHVYIQQAWSRVGSAAQVFDNVYANEGLRRIGNGLWNLFPIPGEMNRWLGRSPVATQMIATIYYSILVFGPFETLRHLDEE